MAGVSPRACDLRGPKNELRSTKHPKMKQFFLIALFISAALATNGKLLVVNVPLLSQFLKTTTIGPNVFGTNILDGASTVEWCGETKPGKTELQGQVNYKNKSGPFSGLFTITRGTSFLGIQVVSGKATYQKDGRTKFVAKLAIIAGNGTWGGAYGQGSMNGMREAALGSPVTTRLTFNVYGTA